MELNDFVRQVAGFSGRSHPERLLLLIWFWHAQRAASRVTPSMIAQSYDELHYDARKVGRDLQRLAERRPAVLLQDSGGYRLEGRKRAELDQQYGDTQQSIVVSKLLSSLPGKLAVDEQKRFLQEAIDCYRVKAFRAAIVLAWILVFDHLLRWILADPARLAAYNARIPVRYPKKGIQIVDRRDFEELKESEVLEIAISSGLISGSMGKVLQKELVRRNLAAHPSPVTMTEHQAADSITDLVTNVMLQL